MTNDFHHIQMLAASEQSVHDFLKSHDFVLSAEIGEHSYTCEHKKMGTIEYPIFKLQTENMPEWGIKFVFPHFTEQQIKQLISVCDFFHFLFKLNPLDMGYKFVQSDNDFTTSTIIMMNGCLSFSNNLFGVMFKRSKLTFRILSNEEEIDLNSGEFNDLYSNIIELVRKTFEKTYSSEYLLNSKNVLLLSDNEVHCSLAYESLFTREHADVELLHLLKDGNNSTLTLIKEDIDEIFKNHTLNCYTFTIKDFNLLKDTLKLCFKEQYVSKIYQLVCMANFFGKLRNDPYQEKNVFAISIPKQNNITKAERIKYPPCYSIDAGGCIFKFQSDELSVLQFFEDFKDRFMAGQKGHNHEIYTDIEDCYVRLLEKNKLSLSARLGIMDNSFCNEHVNVLSMMEF